MIWIDGDMGIVSKVFVLEIMSYMKNGFVVSPHFDGRHCAYGEATIRPPKYANEPLDEQVAFYVSEGFPTEFGLYECGVSVRDLTNPKVKEYQEKYKDKLIVLGINSGDTKEQVEKFITPNGYTWTHLMNGKEADDFVLKFNVAGFDKGDIKIEFTKRIAGYNRQVKVVAQNLEFGALNLYADVPSTIEEKSVRAVLKNGILTISCCEEKVKSPLTSLTIEVE